MRSLVCLVIFLLAALKPAQAARPLATDDAGTVEKGHLEMETGFEYADTANGEYTWNMVLKSGLLENWDIGIEIPYQYIDNSNEDDVDGLGDITFSSKYCLFKDDAGLPALAFSFSSKSETGDVDKGLGTGEWDYTLNMILSKEFKRVVAHLNLGHSYVGTSGSHDDIFAYAWALELPVSDRLNLVGEFIGETNFAGDFDDNPFSGLVGLNYAFSEIAAFDLGIGWGISEASSDYTVTTGLTLSF